MSPLLIEVGAGLEETLAVSLMVCTEQSVPDHPDRHRSLPAHCVPFKHSTRPVALLPMPAHSELLVHSGTAVEFLSMPDFEI